MKTIYQDSAIAVIEKPQNMPSQPDKTGAPDVLSTLQCQLRAATTKDYAAIITRLDRGVGGLLVCALTKPAAATMSKQLADAMAKDYTAVVCGTPLEMSATLTHHLCHNQRTNSTKVVPPGAPKSKAASLEYRVAASISAEPFGTLSLLHIRLHTGRHHQIRVQLSAIGCPLWGDLKYNPAFDKGGASYKAARNEDIPIFPALWASSLSFPHPITGKQMTFSCAPTGYPFSLFSEPLSLNTKLL